MLILFYKPRLIFLPTYLVPMNDYSLDLWPTLGEQIERNAILQVVLDEIETYETALQALERDACMGRLSRLEELELKRPVLAEIRAREGMVRVLALKNTPYVI